MKDSKKLRKITAGLAIALIVVGLFTNWGIGTMSAPGIADISILCPLGALGTMLASKTMVPRAVISLVLVVLFIIVFARAFCGWLCPVPLVSKIRELVSKKPSKSKKNTAGDRESDEVADAGGKDEKYALTGSELAGLKGGCASSVAGKGCAACASVRGKGVDARHFVLGGAVVSTFAFGFPVFCLVCPIGLTFATILLVINLFAHGDVTWSVVAVPVLLAIEVIFFRKWCHKLCPMGAFMSLVGKLNKTFVPTIDNAKCLESTKGAKCGRCAKACEEGIDIRHPELSVAALNECLKCRACVDACPTHAVSMPLLPKKQDK